MKLKQKSILIFIVLLMLIFVMYQTSLASPVIMKIALEMVEGHPNYTAMYKVKDVLEEKLGDRIDVKIYPGAQLGSESDCLEMVRNNTLEVCFVNSVRAVPQKKELGVIALPFLFKNRKHAYEVLNGDIGKELVEGLAEKGMHPIAFWEGGTREIATTKPINSLDDLKGLKIRCMDNAVTMEFVKALGANPISLAFEEVYTAAKSGLIDGTETATVTFYNYGYYEALPYLARVPWNYGTYTIYASEKWWAELPTDLQKIIKDTFLEVGEKFHSPLLEKQHEDVYENLEKEGEILTYPELEPFINAMKPAYEDIWYPEFGEDLINKIRNYNG